MDERCNNTEPLVSRRAILKTIAGAPLVVTFGLAASPLMRFLKPTMKPGNFIQAADLAEADEPVQFQISDFPQLWSCLPFMLPMKYLVFNAQRYEIRKIPCLAIRIENNQVVAFSRICPKRCNHILMLDRPAANGSCGCRDLSCKGYCIGYSKAPVLFCPYDHSVFDVSNHGRPTCGSPWFEARRLIVNRRGDQISISRLEDYGIV